MAKLSASIRKINLMMDLKRTYVIAEIGVNHNGSLELAEQMIIFSGKSIKNSDNPNGDIEIKLIGLRPGEKLYEELLIDAESLPTSHPLIFRAKEKSMDNQKLFSKVDKLLNLLNDYKTSESLKILKELVPEWKKLHNLS